MKILIVASLLFLGLLAPAHAEPTANPAAIQAAKTWLTLVDSGQYTAAWDKAAAVVQQSVKRNDFAKAVSTVRAQVGALKTRTLQSATATTTLPGAPPGQYVVMVFSSSFASKPSATETVTPMLEPDGKWRVSGYYVK